jgi:hypothetical protein
MHPWSSGMIRNFEGSPLLSRGAGMIRRLAERTWAASRKESRIARTAVLQAMVALIASAPFDPDGNCCVPPLIQRFSMGFVWNCCTGRGVYLAYRGAALA